MAILVRITAADEICHSFPWFGGSSSRLASVGSLIGLVAAGRPLKVPDWLYLLRVIMGDSEVNLQLYLQHFEVAVSMITYLLKFFASNANTAVI